MSKYSLKRDEIIASGFFDPEWYRFNNRDVQILGMDPLEHYMWIGARLNRSPGPAFNAKSYMNRNADLKGGHFDALTHYVRHGRREGRRGFEQPAPAIPLPTDETPAYRRITGRHSRRPLRPTILLCSHVAGRHLFGGERSFLDVLNGLNALDYNVVVTVPGSGNPEYMEKLREKSLAIYVMPYGWWKAGIPVNECVVADFARIIAEEDVDAVHSNTIVLREPLLAAQRIGIRSVIHVRELIRHDAALLSMIGEPAEDIVRQIWDSADHLIANSKATQRDFELDGKRPLLVYNTADFEELRAIGPVNSGRIRVGLISSNIPKKGIRDFAWLSKLMEKSGLNISFSLIGPENEHTQKIKKEIDRGDLPATLRICGYRETPAAAIAETDIVVSLSHFYESFGRTVLEAMAAGRPVIAYDHGAPPEFIEHGVTGYVVPKGDVAKVAEQLNRLLSTPGLLRQMGHSARQAAERSFGRVAFANQMRDAYAQILTAPEQPARPTLLPARGNLSAIPRQTLRIAYFCWHFPVPSETFVLNELRMLREQGFDVRVFCRQSPHPDFKPDFDIEWERVSDAEALSKRLIETNRDIVHAHFVYPTVTDMVWPAAEMSGVPFTCIAHAQDIFRYQNVDRNRIAEFSRSESCRKIFVPSKFHHAYLLAQGVPNEKLFINPNGCDPRLYSGGWQDRRSGRPFRKVVAVHRFTEKKGLVHLIRAGKRLEAEGITIELHGYGDLEEEYRQILREEGITNVEIHGPVRSREDLLALYREADLFACPSVRAQDGDMDGVPTVLMEAMASGLPVLTTELSGIPDLVRDRVTGMVCEPTPDSIARSILDFYALPAPAVEAMIENAFDHISRNFDTGNLVEFLLRVWANETIDLMIVSWNNLPQLSEVISRLYRNTALPFHLIVCDNGSDKDTVSYLLRTYGREENFTLVLNRKNAYVGPGTNICLQQGRSDYAIYVCGKEGMTTGHGWDKSVVSYMNANSDIGQAGTLCYSPHYLKGRDYPAGQPLFQNFRNKEFALKNPDREFRHVQGGFFALRRSMIDSIGGFSEEVPHNSTDVEFSFYVESRGWRLGELPGMMALFNKTRPGLAHRVDESHSALHPPTLSDLPNLDHIARGDTHHCNVCGLQCNVFLDMNDSATCPNCNSTRRDRSVFRFLAESTFLYRRLPAMAIGLNAGLYSFWKDQFQGRILNASDIRSEIASNGRTAQNDGGLHLILLNSRSRGSDLIHDDLDNEILVEIERLLAPQGTFLLSGYADLDMIAKRLREHGLRIEASHRYASSVVQYDWLPIHLCRKHGSD